MNREPLAAEHIRKVVEGALLASDGPLTVANLAKLFKRGELDAQEGTKQLREAIKELQEEAEQRGIELKRVASGYRYQVRQELSEWVSRLWDEKPPRYTRALLETLALIAYKQPVTRGDIEQVRGVSVSQNIMRTLVERDWIKVVGQKEVPGRPSLYGTTKSFLDYFNLKSLEEMPPLAEIRALIEPTIVGEELEIPEMADLPIDPDGMAEDEDLDHMLAATDEAGDDLEDHDPEAEEGISVHVDTISPAESAPTDSGEKAAQASAGIAVDVAEPIETAEVVQLHTGANQPNK
jgi:segregation and condensation protein B